MAAKQFPKLVAGAFAIRRFSSIPGWLSWKEALTLYHLAKMLPPKSIIVEIGSWKGKSTYCLARGARDGAVYAIDPFDASGEPGSAEHYAEEARGQDLHQEFCDRMKTLGVDKVVKPTKGFSADHREKFDKIDLLFIDGDHSVEGCVFDYESYGPKVSIGGYIALHDYSSVRKELGPTHVAEKMLLPSGSYEFVGLFGSLWVARKLS